MLILATMITTNVWAADPTATFDYTSSSQWSTWGITAPTTTSTGVDLDDDNDYAFTVGVVTMTFTDGSSTVCRCWKASGSLEFRFYSGSTVTFSVPSGYAIKSIYFNSKSSMAVGDPTGGSWSTNTWSPAAETYPTSVRIDASGSAKWTSVTVTYAATKLLSSIAKKTNATKTTYIEGETFNPAGLVITATYSDASTEDIAYTGNEAKFSFSPSTATALTTGNTSVTVTYGGQSCSQSITVRSITLQAKDEDGNAIPGGGPGAPTFTAATRTITAAANAGNYVFKEWVVSNASATSTTTTPTTITSAAPTGNVTVTAKYYKPISVSWMVKGVAWTPAQLGTSAVGYNTAWSALTLPTDPTTGDGCGDKFMGWVTETIETPLDKTDDAVAISALNILNSGNKSGKTTKITTTTTFHAVFADYAE